MNILKEKNKMSFRDKYKGYSLKNRGKLNKAIQYVEANEITRKLKIVTV